MIFQVIWKASLQFGYYVIYKGRTGLLVNVSLGLYPVYHFPELTSSFLETLLDCYRDAN